MYVRTSLLPISITVGHVVSRSATVSTITSVDVCNVSFTLAASRVVSLYQSTGVPPRATHSSGSAPTPGASSVKLAGNYQKLLWV